MASVALKCSVCFDRFDEHKHCPRLLKCGDYFCSNCLKEIHQDNKIECPKCRKINPVPPNSGICGLPKNFSVLDVVLGAAASPPEDEKEKRASSNSPTQCEVCPEEHPATSYCMECKSNVCSESVRSHKRIALTRKHRVVTLVQICL